MPFLVGDTRNFLATEKHSYNLTFTHPLTHPLASVSALRFLNNPIRLQHRRLTTPTLPSQQRPVTKVTTATQTGEAVDEVLRNSDSTLIRLLVTGQDLTNGYRLCPNGQVRGPGGRSGL